MSVESSIQLTQFNDPQKLGSAITYYRRYTLQSLLGLQAEDDDANKASTKEPVLNVEKLNARLMACATKAELQTVYTSFTPAEKTATLKLNCEKLNQLSPETVQAIQNGNIMEVSIGVFTDTEEKEGEWNGETYERIAHNHRPDHLALQPRSKDSAGGTRGALAGHG